MREEKPRETQRERERLYYSWGAGGQGRVVFVSARGTWKTLPEFEDKERMRWTRPKKG